MCYSLKKVVFSTKDLLCIEKVFRSDDRESTIFKRSFSNVYKFGKGSQGYSEKEKNADGSSKVQSTVQRSYCFDYAALVANFSINLERAKDTDIDTAHIEDTEAATPKQTKLNLT